MYHHLYHQLDTWYKVMKVPGLMTKDARGELHIAFSLPEVSAFAPRGLGSSKKERAAAAAQHFEPGKPNLLYVTIDSGKDLLAMDRNNSSDPFVKLSMVGQRHQTSTVAKTLKPHWDEKFAFLVTDPHATLELLVEDEDHTINDFLGRAQLVLVDVLEFNVEKRVAVKLLDKRLRDDKDRGTLQLRLSWIYDENAEAITSMSLRKKKTQSLLQQFKQSMRVGATGADNEDDNDDDEADDDELIDDESDDDTSDSVVRPPLPPDASWLQFLVATIHRAEELPALDSLLFDKGDLRKHSGGGIDAYVSGALTTDSDTDSTVRTRVHTRHGRRDQLSPVFHESLMLLVPPSPALGDAEAEAVVTPPVDASFSVNDWDPIGGDEVVGHFVLNDAVALATARKSQPFWVNLYGAPVRGCSNNSTAAVRMNQQPALASTYRGRVLLSLNVRSKSSDAYDAKHQKRMARKLPRDLYPTTVVYRMRAHFVSATGLAQANRTYSVVVSCGLREIASSRKKAASGAVEWNETEESDKMLYPEDARQIPDVFVYLCTGQGEGRRTIAYQRFTAASLIDQAFDGPAAWVPLIADTAIGQVNGREVFPGTVLLRLGFGTAEASNTHVWDQKAMIEHVNRRMPYQVRVRLHGARDLVASDADSNDSATPLSVRVAVQCWEDQKQLQATPKEPTTSPQWNETLCFDAHLPHLPYAPPVLVHVFNHDNARDYVGTATLSLSPDGTPPVAVSSARQLKQNERKHLPVAHWTPVLFNGDDDAVGATSHGHVLASVELIHKTFPDEMLPDPEPLTTPVDGAAEL